MIRIERANYVQVAGASSLVLDLRGNGGGVLDGALGIAGGRSSSPRSFRGFVVDLVVAVAVMLSCRLVGGCVCVGVR